MVIFRKRNLLSCLLSFVFVTNWKLTTANIYYWIS